MKMTPEEKEIMDAAARVIEKQAQENPDLSIPVDPDVADHMGAFTEEAISMDDVDNLFTDEGVNENHG